MEITKQTHAATAPPYTPATVPAFTAEEICCHVKGFDCAYKLGEYRALEYDQLSKSWSLVSGRSNKRYTLRSFQGDTLKDDTLVCTCPAQSVCHHLCALFIYLNGNQYPLRQISRALHARAERVKAAELDRKRLLILEDLRNKWTARILTAVEGALKFKPGKFATYETPHEWREGEAEFKLPPRLNLEILGVRFDVRRETKHLFTPVITAVKCDCGKWLEDVATFEFRALEAIAQAEKILRADTNHSCEESEAF